uniref:Uncharacterized protein n=1 Tax=Vitis vinifera TaxID=29760 RepID=A5BBJ5_VITVI|nr:hypothetical protein VITISV_034978 [Vitis vinifera]
MSMFFLAADSLFFTIMRQTSSAAAVSMASIPVVQTTVSVLPFPGLNICQEALEPSFTASPGSDNPQADLSSFALKLGGKLPLKVIVIPVVLAWTHYPTSYMEFWIVSIRAAAKVLPYSITRTRSVVKRGVFIWTSTQVFSFGMGNKTSCRKVHNEQSALKGMPAEARIVVLPCLMTFKTLISTILYTVDQCMEHFSTEFPAGTPGIATTLSRCCGSPLPSALDSPTAYPTFASPRYSIIPAIPIDLYPIYQT